MPQQKPTLFQKTLGCATKLDGLPFRSWQILQRAMAASGSGEFLQFLAVAKGSACEVISHVYVALDQGYINRQKFERLNESAERTLYFLGGLMTYLQQSNIKGAKYERYFLNMSH